METLYRFFDEQGQLLYVGISNNWTQRLNQHYKDSTFFEKAKHITLSHYETRAEVEEAERKAIETEGALFNKKFNPDYEDSAAHFQKIKAWVYTKAEADDKHKGMINELRDLFMSDANWISKKAAPIAYYLFNYLPDWDDEFEMGCDFCVNLYHSKNIEIWASSYYERLVNATN
jgi:predicted GIY-YIG superfamily endonuclease